MNLRPTLLTILRERLADWHEPLALIIGLRLALGILSLFTGFLYPLHAPLRIPDFALPALSFWSDRLLGIWAHWDGLWYLKIATLGYQADLNTLAFFPLYPGLVNMLGRLLGGSYLLAGVLLSTILSLVAVVLFYDLARHDTGPDTAGRAVLYLVAFPTAFYLYAVYTEALFLTLAVGALWAARRRRQWWLAGLLAALAALTRNLGVFLALVLAWEWFSQQYHLAAAQSVSRAQAWRAGLRSIWQPPLLATLLPIAALAGWMTYTSFSYNTALGPVNALQYWGRAFAWPWQSAADSVNILITWIPNYLTDLKPLAAQIDELNFELINLFFLIIGLTLLVYGSWRCLRQRLPVSYLLFLAAGLMLPLFGPIPNRPLVSYPRYMLVLFPLHLLAAQLGVRWRWLHYLWLGLSLALQGVFFVRFATGFWVA